MFDEFLFFEFDTFLKDEIGTSLRDASKLFEKFKLIFWFDKFWLSLFLRIHFKRLKTIPVEWPIALFADSIWAPAIPVLSLFSVIEGQFPAKRLKWHFKWY